MSPTPRVTITQAPERATVNIEAEPRLQAQLTYKGNTPVLDGYYTAEARLLTADGRDVTDSYLAGKRWVGGRLSSDRRSVRFQWGKLMVQLPGEYRFTVNVYYSPTDENHDITHDSFSTGEVSLLASGSQPRTFSVARPMGRS